MQVLTKMGASLVIGMLVAASASAQDQSAIATGAGVYGRTCARCHNLRAPTERSDREWGVIVQHMRSRANLTKADAQAVLAFLRATNGDNALPAAGGAQPAANGTAQPDSADVAERARLRAYLRQLQDDANSHVKPKGSGPRG